MVTGDQMEDFPFKFSSLLLVLGRYASFSFSIFKELVGESETEADFLYGVDWFEVDGGTQLDCKGRWRGDGERS